MNYFTSPMSIASQIFLEFKSDSRSNMNSVNIMNDCENPQVSYVGNMMQSVVLDGNLLDKVDKVELDGNLLDELRGRLLAI